MHHGGIRRADRAGRRRSHSAERRRRVDQIGRAVLVAAIGELCDDGPTDVLDPLRRPRATGRTTGAGRRAGAGRRPRGRRWHSRSNDGRQRRDIDFARVSLPNFGGITEMLKIMAVCDTHRVGIVRHFTGPIATAGHMHTMMAFPGQVLMEYNQGRAAGALPARVPRVPQRQGVAERSSWSLV
jgi:hypothetical protein